MYSPLSQDLMIDLILVWTKSKIFKKCGPYIITCTTTVYYNKAKIKWLFVTITKRTDMHYHWWFKYEYILYQLFLWFSHVFLTMKGFSLSSSSIASKASLKPFGIRFSSLNLSLWSLYRYMFSSGIQALSKCNYSSKISCHFCFVIFKKTKSEIIYSIL